MKRDDVALHKRTYPRVKATFSTQLRLKNVAPTIPSTLWGKTTNLSEGGLSIILESPISVSSLVALRINHSLAPVEAEAQVAWIKPVGNIGKFHCGMRFSKLAQRDLSALRKILEEATTIVTASYLPEKVVTNQDIINAGLKTTPITIERGLGVRERRAAAPDESGADMMAKVAEKILKKAGCLPEDLDCIICSADPGDAVAPETATAVQAKIGATCPAFGVSMSCTGWIVGVDFALHRLDKGEKRILVLASSLGSRIFYRNLRDRAIFGDGAGGILLESHHRDRFLAIGEIADGRDYSKIFVPYPWSVRPPEIPVEYDGSFYMSEDQKVFLSALEFYLPRFVKRILNEAEVKLQDINLFLLHYPSKPLFEYSLKLLGIPRSKTFNNFIHYGNLVAAEMPVFLDEAISIGRIKKNDLIFILPYGAGFTMGGLIMQY